MQQLITRGVLTFPPRQTIPESAYATLLGLTPATSVNKVTIDLEDNAVNPYSIQGSLGVDRQLGRDWNLSLNYLLNHGLHALLRGRSTRCRIRNCSIRSADRR